MSYFGNHIFSIWMGELLLFDQYLLFLLLARMTCVVVGYALQNYEVSVGYPKYTLYMEFFIVVMTLAGFTLSVYLSLEIYNLFILSFIAPYLLFLDFCKDESKLYCVFCITPKSARLSKAKNEK